MGRDKRINVINRHDEYTKKLYELMKEKTVYGETKEFYVIEQGTKTTYLRK
jgi:16S rRNA G1207 methylase RsmC